MNLAKIFLQLADPIASSYVVSGSIMWKFDAMLYVDLASLGYKIKKEKLSEIYHLIIDMEKGKVDPLLLPITNLVFSVMVMFRYYRYKRAEDFDIVMSFLKDYDCIELMNAEELKEYQKSPTYYTALKISKRKKPKTKAALNVNEKEIEEIDNALIESVKRRFISHFENEKETSITYYEEEDRIVIIDIDGYINELSFEEKLYEIKRLLKIYIPMLNINFPFDNMDVMLLNDKEEVHFTTLNKSDFKEDINYLSQEELITKDEKTLKLTNI